MELQVKGCSTCPLAGQDREGHGAPCRHPKAPKEMRINPRGESHAEGCPLWKDDVNLVAHFNKQQETCCSMDREQQDALMSIVSTGTGPVNREMLENLQDFEVLDDDFSVTPYGFKVYEELKRGYGR